MAGTRLGILFAACALGSGCGGDANAPAPAGPAPAPAAPAAAPAAPAAPGIRFEECAESAGLRFRTTFLKGEQGERFKINLYDHGSGLAVADFDGDGKDDVYLLNQLGPNGLFRNRGDGTFEDVTAAAGVALGDRICVAASFADVEGDGDQDLFVTSTRGGNVFFENLGGGKFRDATKEAGLALAAESMGAAFFDADGDGDLDLLVTNTARWTLDTFDAESRYYPGKGVFLDVLLSEKEKNVFYRNDGKGRFTDATEESGLGGRGWADDAAVFDMDDDGDLDVYVPDMFGANSLFRNDGKGRFADCTREVLGKTSWGALGARAFDYDGDGRIDLMVSDMHSDMWGPMDIEREVVEEKVKYPTFFARMVALGRTTAEEDRAFETTAGIRRDEVVFGNTLFRNKGGGAFEEVSDRAGAETFWPWGVAEGDFDGDGYLDVFLPSGMGFPFFHWRNPLLRNRGDGTFEDVGKSAGIEPRPGGPTTGEVLGRRHVTRSSRAAATADFDGDGRLDLAVSNFNERAYLYRNVSAPGHWCGLRLTGAGANRDAIGALARLTAGGRTQVRQVQASSGYLSQSTKALHFGLGGAATVDRVEIRWPDGSTQVLDHPPADRWIPVVEPAR